MDEILKLERKLNRALLNQNFLPNETDDDILTYFKKLAEAYVVIENNLVVLSDFKNNESYIYSGGFGKNLGFGLGEIKIKSAFEKELFDLIHPEDLLERHALELSYLNLLKDIDLLDRTNYISYCNLRIKNQDGNYIIVNHRMQYVKSSDDGGIWLALCVYTASTDSIPGNGINGRILNSSTGKVTVIHNLRNTQKSILTRREIQILKHLAKGCTSKEISSELHLSTNTIYRHRQNIIEKLNVHNSSEAIQVGILLGLLK